MLNPPLRVCSFESRRADEIRSLLERQGAIATVAPSMRELPLDDNPAAFAFTEELLAGQIDVMIFMTGVGARALKDVLDTKSIGDAFVAALEQCTVVVRGPKPVVVLREWGVRIDHRAPEPNTWRELLATLDAEVEVQGKRIAVQEYGVPNADFYKELTRRGALVVTVPVYRWAFPEDIGPLEEAVRQTLAGAFDVLMFTSANQLHNVVQCARDLEVVADWLDAARRCRIASIGPTATETIQSYGLPVHLEPSHPKMGTLVREIAETAPEWFPDRVV
ncbi:MAG: uroporphyrinogen III synthase [Planctomycetales bacterium 12-60-4]|nr:MAG: uroporphyrinogen III synthase [Planctomycetales bacterium 12-60-4]